MYTKNMIGDFMNMLKVKAYGKVNLSLGITGKKENGYHLVEMIMQQISLHDVVTVKKIQSGIVLTTNCPFIPNDQSNIAFKVAEAMLAKFNIQSGVSIHIEKNIPVAAGLAGGSADAAGVIEAIDKIFNLNMSRKDRQAFALPFGADIPFCLQGGTAIATGIGEDLEKIKGLDNTWLVLVKPSVKVSTESVYKAFDLNKVVKQPNTQKIKRILEMGHLKELSGEMVNVLEEVTGKEHPVIYSIEQKLKSFGAIEAMMSGSGPTVFGVFMHYKTAEKAYKNMCKTEKDVFLVKGCQGGNHDE